MKQLRSVRVISRILIAVIVVASLCAAAAAQKKPKPKTPANKPVEQPQSEMTRLRDEYVKAAQEYKASLQKLQTLYQDDLKKKQEKRDQAQKLFADGLMSKRDLEQTEMAITGAQLKVTEVQQQIKTADSQIAEALVEVEGEKQMAKLGPLRHGLLIRTTSFIRYNGVGAWSLSQAGKIELFFQQTFKRPLPIAVFGQGAIHNQWRLDHHNAMDIQLSPDGAEGQALINFLQSNGIPFSAFRMAIPGVATGPHIHIGMPSHRY